MDFDVYHSYTQALRHPVVIGHVAGWRLPWALSASQLGAVASMSGLLLATRPVWAHFGAVGNLAVFTVSVAGVGWAVRHWRIEGRSPFLAAAGGGDGARLPRLPPRHAQRQAGHPATATPRQPGRNRDPIRLDPWRESG